MITEWERNAGDRRLGILRDLGVWPQSPPLADLVAVALDRQALSVMDLQSIRDLRFMHDGLSDDPDLEVLLIGMLVALNSGSACLRDDAADTPSSWLFRLLPLPEDSVHGVMEAWRRIRKRLAQDHAWPALMATAVPGIPPRRPLVRVARGGRHFFYFQRYWRHEQGVRDALGALAGRPPAGTAAGSFRQALAQAARYEGFSLTGEQLLAVHVAMRQPLALITGGPGSGKTTVICSLLRAWLAQGAAPDRMALVAPTGRAGRRMGEAIRDHLSRAVDIPDAHREAIRNLTGSTIHRLLRYRPATHSFAYDEHHPLPVDTLIVDEVSMVDLVLMDHLLHALPPTCRVILLGDPEQLPSVDPGTVLGDLLPRDCIPRFSPESATALEALVPGISLPRVASGPRSPLTDRIVRLSRSHRNRGHLADVAARVSRGEATEAWMRMRVIPFGPSAHPAAMDWTSPPDSCVRLEGLDLAVAADLRRLTLSWTGFFIEGRHPSPGPERETPEPSLADRVRQGFPVEDLNGEGESRRSAMTLAEGLLSGIEAFRLLTMLRRGPCGSETLNRMAMDYWRRRLDPDAPPQMPLFAGAPVMITRNDPAHGLFNGDIGIVVRSGTGGYYAIFRGGDGYLACPVGRLPEHEPAFAVTIHKSQGSQYRQVLLVLPSDPGHPMLVRELLYTGMTRASNSAFIAGSEAVVQAAVSRRLERQSGLDLWSVSASLP